MTASHVRAAETALRDALNAVEGNQSKLARICGCTQGAVWQMLNKPQPMLSVQYVLKVEAALGIPRHHLRPDVYPDPASDRMPLAATA